jgi:hypothetical protein
MPRKRVGLARRLKWVCWVSLLRSCWSFAGAVVHGFDM